MGFSGGGSNVLKPHTHDGTIAQDGGSLNMDNVTQAALQAGDVVYSDGVHLQRLAYPAVPANESLTATAASTAPSWAAGGATGSFQFVEKFVLGADSNTFTGTLAVANQFDATDYDIRVTLTGKHKTAVGTIDFRILSTGTVGTVSNWYWSNKLSGGVQSGQQDGNKTYFYLTQADQMGATALFGSILDFTRNADNGNLFGQYSITLPTQDYYQGGLYCEGDFTTIEDIELFTDGGEFEAGTEMQIWKVSKA